MKVYAINGSPRRNKNTATLLTKVLEGVRAAHPEAETELIHLGGLKFSGCKSCFACKLKNAKTNGVCAIKDDLRPVLEKLHETDAAVFGSPIYYRTITGQLHSFYERYFFPYMQYKVGYPTLVEKKIPTACVYTMNVLEDEMIRDGYRQNMELFENFLAAYFTPPKVLIAFNTYQFDNYDRYVCEVFTAEEKAAYRDAHFPEDCQKAFELGRDLLYQ